MAIRFDRGSRLLFIGDSITDCNRRKDPDELGSGYVRLIADHLSAFDPWRAPAVLNRGISGNKVPDLEQRWQRDVIDLRPDVLSVFIGVNDVWHGFKPDRQGCTLPDYVAGYRRILGLAREALPHLQLVLCEPSSLRLAEPADAHAQLQPYVEAIGALAVEFEADAVVPLYAAFNGAYEQRPDIAWTTDGVHPTSTGHMLIARSWLRATGGGGV
jgi:lysophospholipase L1-like esterase